jgi:SAM-dependent methyltransferase
MADQTDDLYHVRARSFGAHARDYAEHRPGYPGDGVRWALSAAGRPVHDVLDLAAGTGKLTECLLPLGMTVTAVEPDDGMRAELTSRFPRVTALSGTAEAIPLAADSFDAVLVGQAFHWFDRTAALTEIGRVLRTGGALGLLWNGEDESVEWVAGLMAAAGTSVTATFQEGCQLPAHPLFATATESVFPHVHRRTIPSLVETLGTHSRMLVISPAEREAVMDRLLAYLSGRRETSDGEFDVPLMTKVIRSTRR